MKDIVSITSQGQLTIPKHIRRKFGISGAVKAAVRIKDRKIVVEPQMDFWALSGSLNTGKKLTDAELRKARQRFEKDWARKL